MNRVLLRLRLALPLLALPASADAQRDDFPLVLGAAREIRMDDVGILVAAAATPDGRLVALDYAASRVVAYDAEGRVAWRAGRKGDGPGEFQMPYRIGACPDGSVVVLDQSRGDVTWISPAGRSLRRLPLPARLTQANQLVCPDGRHLVLAGVSRDARMAGRGVHVFAAEARAIRHVRSFGMLPPTNDEVVRSQWGAGTLSVTANGDLLYTLLLPYRVFRFTLAGTPRGEWAGPALPHRPDQAFRIERSAEGMSIGRGIDVLVPRLTFEVGGHHLGGHGNQAGGRLHLFDRSGRLLGSRTLPAGWQGILAVDARRSVLWAYGSDEAGEPVLYRVPFTFRSPSTRRP